jgi:hypothetical protein
MHEQDKPTREHLVAHLAEVSHETWMRQAERDKGLHDLDAAITEHDWERAEDTVRELERLGVFREEPTEPVGFTVVETAEGEKNEEEQ